MRKLIYSFFIMTAVLASCSKEKLDQKSFFDTDSPERGAFDTWLLLNYVEPYNIQFNYKYIDRESDNNYNLVPAEYDKAVAMAKLTKYLWIDSYNELLGDTFIKTYCPRMIQLIGSKAFNSQGSVVLGTAEGGLKITLYNINGLNPSSPSIDFLNEWFFKTMHHEFAHILHQTKNYSTDFNLISTDYQGPSWLNLESDAVANKMGYVTCYASYSPDEDFVEIISNYVTHAKGYWESVLATAGEEGGDKLARKFEIVRNYLQESWGIDIDKLRDIVQKRSANISQLDLKTL
jgi:substrate import-associated zinc metallohydrolase lipoprotein